MKNINIIAWMLLSFLITQTRLFAQDSFSTFSGIFDYNKKDIPDSLMIWTYPNNNLWDTTVDYNVRIDKDKKFNFTLPNSTKPLMFQIRLMNAGRTTLIGTYFLEPNDNVRIRIIETSNPNKDSVEFIGKGSSKYNLATKLYNDQLAYLFNYNGEKLKYPTSSATFDSLEAYLKNNLKIIEHFTDKRNSLINSYKDVTAEMKVLLNYGVPSYYDRWFDTMYYLYKKPFKEKGDFRRKIKEHFNENYSKMIGELDNLNYLAPFYCQTFSSRIKINQFINAETDGVDLEDYYNTIKNLYNGKIRERLLAEFLMSHYTMGDIINFDPITYDSLVLDASKYMPSASSREIIAKKLTFKKGTGVYPANFEYLDGKTFNISSMVGKVFLIDIWGTGCGGCSLFHDRFEREVWPFLKDFKDFSVVAIHNGKTKKRWIEGMESKLYTRSEYINVSTIPFGTNHPFLKYYNINYSPFLLLVDRQGKVVSHISPNIQPKELLKLINSAISIEKKVM